MLKKAINNVRRMASHPTLPYCKFIFFLKREELCKDYVFLTHLFVSVLLFCISTTIYCVF